MSNQDSFDQEHYGELKAYYDEAERFRNLYIETSGLLAIIASWLRGNHDDLNAQQIYDQIALEQGLPAEVIRTELVSKELTL